MAIETVGKYQLHLVAYQLPENGQWAPYLMIHKFDDGSDSFQCVLDRHRVAGDRVFATYEEAIEAARHAGNAVLEAGTV
jgi:hypothetical protein